MFINELKADKILNDTAYIHTSGTDEEKKCAEYIASLCREIGFDAIIEPFPVRMYDVKKEVLTIDGKNIPCKSWHGTGSGKVSGDIYVLEGDDEVSLSKCKDKVVLCLKSFKGMYDKLYKLGAVAGITFDGNFYYDDRDINTRIYGQKKDENNNLPMITINVKDAFDIVKNECKRADVDVEISEYVGTSHNVIVDIKGESDETVIACAHYDTTPLSVGAFDNMSSCITLFYLAEYFKDMPLKRNLRLLWCGSEETGLVGSRSYCKYHVEDLKKTVLNINLDLLGCAMGSFTSFSCADEEMEKYLKEFVVKKDFPSSVRLAIRSSDSNSFVEAGVPAVSFARYDEAGIGEAHTRYDTSECMSSRQLIRDSEFICAFTEHAVNKTGDFPEKVTVCDKIREDVRNYMANKVDVL